MGTVAADLSLKEPVNAGGLTPVSPVEIISPEAVSLWLRSGRPGWMKRAACDGMAPGDFFASGASRIRRAIKVCESCEVKTECLDYALGFDASNDEGVWGGTTPAERRKMRRARPAFSGVRPLGKAPAKT